MVLSPYVASQVGLDLTWLDTSPSSTYHGSIDFRNAVGQLVRLEAEPTADAATTRVGRKLRWRSFAKSVRPPRAWHISLLPLLL